jgi:hypothetical protein
MKLNMYKVSIIALIMGLAFQVTAQRKTIQVSSFDEISMGTSGTVYVTQGNETKVEVVASDDRLEKTEIEVNGNRLVIRNKGSWSWNRNMGDLDVYVVTPDISALSVSGSGKLIVQNKINVNDLDLSVSGSGKLIAGVNAKRIEISISGSGNVELSGTSESFDASISGSGNVRAEDLRTGKCEVTISGSGGCEIFVNETIDARISGSGSVRYHGSPSHVNSKTSGSGSVKKVG